MGTCDVDPYGVGAITTIWDWLVQVNAEGGSGFAGHSDWRLPSEEGCNSCYVYYHCPCAPAELGSILLAPYPCGNDPCVDPIFGPTASYRYWSSTTSANPPSSAWIGFFSGGGVLTSYKYDSNYIRAVRGDLRLAIWPLTRRPPCSTDRHVTLIRLPAGVGSHGLAPAERAAGRAACA